MVADASALVEYLFGTERSESAKRFIRLPDADLHVPALCDVEVAAALRRSIATKLIPVDRAELCLEDYLDLPLTRHGHQALLPRIVELKANFTAYDATYLALAEKLGAELLTKDDPFAKAVKKYSRVVVLS